MFLYAVSLSLAVNFPSPTFHGGGCAVIFFLVTSVSGVHRLTIYGDAIAQMGICEYLFAVGDG